jgi:8-oxo-dGTP pyrophosphatase MutT (NUDIX family)
MTRRSDIAYIVARFALGNKRYLLLRKHPKWGDWSLVGGHVEPFEKRDWARAAIREAQEELDPLTFRRDFILLPLLRAPITWGPVPSQSARGALTEYTAQYFALRLTASPEESLARLPDDDFVLFDEDEVETTGAANGALAALRKSLAHGLDDVPLAADRRLSPAAIRIRRVKGPPRVGRSSAVEGASESASN